MNDMERKRQALLAAYPGLAWANKVKSMSDAQALAVYTRLKTQGKV